MDSASLTSSTVTRRMVTLPAVVVIFVLLVPSLVVVLPVAAVVDLIRGRNVPTVRLILFGVGYLAWEMVAIVVWVVMGLATGFGRFQRSAWSIKVHRAVQRAWLLNLVKLAKAFFKMNLEVTGADQIDPGPVIILSRHASIVDTILPAAHVFGRGMDARCVLKRELLVDPCLDLIANRMPNYFIDRSGADTAHEVEALNQLATALPAEEAIVIFPEGTRWSPEKRRHVIDRLAVKDPELARRAEENEFTMPPRSAGTRAILAGAPDADVVIMSHTGLEGFTGLAEALRVLPFRSPIRIDFRRIPRSEVPTDPNAQSAWILDQWNLVDAWVEDNIDPRVAKNAGVKLP